MPLGLALTEVLGHARVCWPCAPPGELRRSCGFSRPAKVALRSALPMVACRAFKPPPMMAWKAREAEGRRAKAAQQTGWNPRLPTQCSRPNGHGGSLLLVVQFFTGLLTPSGLQRPTVFSRLRRLVAVQFTPIGADSAGVLHDGLCEA